MKRRLFNVLAGLCVVLWIAILCLWVRSGWRWDEFGCEGRQSPDHWQRGGYVDSASGEIGCDWWLRQNGPRYESPITGWSGDSRPISQPGPPPAFEYQAFTYDPDSPRSDGRPDGLIGYAHHIQVPYWFLLLILSLPLTLWFIAEARRRRTWRRLRNAQCETCGYDLRATPDRCPECGTVPKLTEATK